MSCCMSLPVDPVCCFTALCCLEWPDCNPNEGKQYRGDRACPSVDFALPDRSLLDLQLMLVLQLARHSPT